MKKSMFIPLICLAFTGVTAQNSVNRNSIAIGGCINQYNGNLGSSFFKYKATCFGGVNATFGRYINRHLDFNANVTVGHFGYCQTQQDILRLSALELKCPGCTDGLGMAELRSLMIGTNLGLKYKFNNGYILKENSRVAPFVYAGAGVSHLSDNMKKECVNTGLHWSLNFGGGVKYNITEKFFMGYTAGFNCFMNNKVYAELNNTGHSEETAAQPDHHSDEMKNLEKRKDILLQNTLSIGINF